jgi:hypothetical protein
MISLFLKSSRRGFMLCCLGGLLLSGCDGKRSSPASSSSPGPSTVNASRPLFEGVIKVKEQRDLMLNSSEITYTIAKGRIRREAKPIAPLGRLAELGAAKAGVICDVPNETVVLYRSGLAGKFFVRMALADYRKQVANSVSGLTDVTMDLPGTRPLLWRNVGTFFAYLPRPIPTGHARNLPEARTVGDRLCDLLTIADGDTAYEVCHCNTLAFDRPLLELVELALPAEVTGFPCQMRRLRTVSSPAVDPAQSKAWQLLGKGADLAAKAAEKAMKYEIDLVSVTEGVPADASFSLDSSFVELGSWAEFSLRFDPPEEHHHHGDWD